MTQNSKTTETLNQALARLKGKPISSIEFLKDYLQLRFDGPCLTAYTAPTIRVGLASQGWGDPGYFDSLCAQIGAFVDEAGANDEQVTISFESGVRLAISLREQDYLGPEAVQFVTDDQTWVI